ncbi:MAG: VOC family protein [Reichenbachiella sp.]|uniref:VOC family protein n=1 Tax=Reichenbachiella sp. TaxID=2184521 RepID=UPI003263541E
MQQLTLITLVVAEYDEAIDFYIKKLGFELIEDTPQSDTKRWVVVKPPGSAQCGLLLAKAVNDEQKSRIGNQTGGRVFLFFHTDDFKRDYNVYVQNGVEIVRPPVEQPYGMVAVFADLYGNKFDLIEPMTSVT